MRGFFWLSGQAMSGLVWGWPVSMALLGGLAAALIFNNPFRRARYRHGNWLCIAPAFLTVALVAVGALFEHDGGPRRNGPIVLLWGMAVTHLAASGWLAWKLKDIRLFALAANLCILWCSFWALAVSLMSVSGDWM